VIVVKETDTLMLLIQKEIPSPNNVGCVSPAVRSLGLKLRLTILFIILIIVSGCSEFALLMSGGSIAVSQNTYAKVYNGVDILTIMSTEKSLKGHAYDSAKKAWTEVKEGKEYIYDSTINLFGNKH
jgi:hypothetical protein|tara:strand:- start:245 stop:622 length:378 start_codon:yes stop_codon:yes gene_type:complete